VDDQIQDPEEQPQPAPEPEPAPRPSREQLIGALAEDLGWSPEQVAGSFQLRNEYERARQDYDRRLSALEQREREIENERERARFQSVSPEFQDPGTRMLYEMMMDERQERKREREERRQQEESERMIAQQAQAFGDSYNNFMRGVPTHQQVDIDTFVDNGMRRLYPEGIPASLGPDQAIANVARFLGITNGNGYTPPAFNSQPNRRAVIPIPTAPQSQGGQMTMSNSAQLEGETPEQYLDRLTKLVRAQNLSLTSLPEGRKFSSG